MSQNNKKNTDASRNIDLGISLLSILNFINCTIHECDVMIKCCIVARNIKLQNKHIIA